MRVDEFDRVVCLTVDSRFPEWPMRARREVEGKGAGCEIFINGSARVAEIGRHRYAQLNGDVPAGFDGRRGAYHLARAFIEVVRRADADGVERLLVVEDDLEFTADYERACAAIHVPGDWGLYYFGANHTWATTAEISPHLLRVVGSYTTHCVGVHRRAFAAVLGLAIDRPIDVMLAGLHTEIPSYAAWPSVAVQRPGVSTISEGTYADYGAWLQSKGKNWPAPAPTPPVAGGRPSINPAVRDAVLACPHRGSEGGLVLLPEEKSCCGGGEERTACAIGRGLRPGRVTLRDCLACKSAELAGIAAV